MQQIREKAGCEVRLVTPKNLNDVLEEFDCPNLHPAYEYLSVTHKSDYLRVFLCRHVGGAYTDVKPVNRDFRGLIQQLNESDRWFLGQRSQSLSALGGYSVINRLKGVSPLPTTSFMSFAARPGSAFLVEFLNRMDLFLTEKSEQLRKNPATFARDVILEEAKDSYPVGWHELLGSIGHEMQIEGTFDETLLVLPPDTMTTECQPPHTYRGVEGDGIAQIWIPVCSNRRDLEQARQAIKGFNGRQSERLGTANAVPTLRWKYVCEAATKIGQSKFSGKIGFLVAPLSAETLQSRAEAMARSMRLYGFYFAEDMDVFCFSQDWISTFVAWTKNQSFSVSERPVFAPKILWTLWTGDNPMTQKRKENMESIRSKAGCQVRLVTPANLEATLKEFGCPDLHPSYEHLSATHRSDYLRIFLAFHVGGAYVDVKPLKSAVEPWLTKINEDPTKDWWGQVHLLGAFGAKPGSPWMKENLNYIERALEIKKEALKRFPAVYARDVTNKDGSGYPLAWTSLLSFHYTFLKRASGRVVAPFDSVIDSTDRQATYRGSVGDSLAVLWIPICETKEETRKARENLKLWNCRTQDRFCFSSPTRAGRWRILVQVARAFMSKKKKVGFVLENVPIKDLQEFGERASRAPDGTLFLASRGATILCIFPGASLEELCDNV